VSAAAGQNFTSFTARPPRTIHCVRDSFSTWESGHLVLFEFSCYLSCRPLLMLRVSSEVVVHIPGNFRS
jgi:hypothetical protein